MGKTSKPVCIVIIGMDTPPAMAAMREQGHMILNWTTDEGWDANGKPFEECDMIVGPKCWRYLPDISDKFIDRIVKEARAAQPPKPKKAKKEKAQ